MAGMRMSLPGFFKNTELALRSSRDSHACVCAHSLGELVDNLLILKDGGCTVEEFFAVYVFDRVSGRKLADCVKKENFLCMREEPANADSA